MKLQATLLIIWGVIALIGKKSGYIVNNIILIDPTNTVQFDLISPDGTIYNIVAIYAPNGDNTYCTELQEKVTNKDGNYQILIGDFNTTMQDRWAQKIQKNN